MGPESQQGGGEWATPGNDTGDIILTPSEPVKKPLMSKGLLIGVIISVVVIIVLAILAVNSLQGGSILGGDASVRKNFESYAYYLLNGLDDSNDNTSEAELDVANLTDNNVQFAFEEMATSEQSDYWNQLDVKFNQLYKSIKDDNVLSYLDRQSELLTLYRDSADLIYTDNIYEAVENGIASSMLERYWDEAKEDNVLQSYYATMANYIELIINRFQFYDERGCVISDQVDYECVEQIPEDDIANLIPTEVLYDAILAQNEIVDTMIRNNTNELFYLLGGISK